ncbi:hypothetical protein NC651_006243 [Populus alba x Populus x berolinensis]|nr:hypothetical protein NC651_006243 [Populus alba x Populus x berolinensis]
MPETCPIGVELKPVWVTLELKDKRVGALVFARMHGNCSSVLSSFPFMKPSLICEVTSFERNPGNPSEGGSIASWKTSLICDQNRTVKGL